MPASRSDRTPLTSRSITIAGLLLLAPVITLLSAEWSARHASPIRSSPARIDRRIELNSAGAAELQLLPRIGESLAARIVEDRQRFGPFRNIDDLQRVSGIGPRTVEQIAPFAK